MPETLRNAFVCGYPISHSRSPLIHNYWIQKYGIAGSYRAIEVAPAEFSVFIRELRDRNLVGGNITIPHKETVLAFLDESDDASQQIGAVNTVWLEKDRLVGTNTDWLGFAMSMDQSAPGWDGAEMAIVLGAGGAAKGVVHCLATRGISRICIINRTLKRAEELASAYAGATAGSWTELQGLLGQAELLINTTSLGMGDMDGMEIDLANMPSDAIVADIVYVPLETALLRRAREQGLRCVDGLGMLLHQAVPGFEKWFGVRPEVTPELRSRIVADIEGRA